MPYLLKVSTDTPRGGFGNYAKIGLLEVEPGTTHVAMISQRATGVIRVVETWPGLFRGKTDACAFSVALEEAKILCDRLNKEEVTHV